MATYTNLDNEIFARNALEGFVYTLTPLAAFSTNFSDDALQKGGNVLVPLIGSITATTFSAYNACGGSMSVITVALTNHKVAQVGQSDITAHTSSVAQLERFAFQQGAGLATLVLQDILKLCTTANYASATAVTSTTMDVAQIRKARITLNQANCPMTARSLILDCVPYDALLGVTNFVQAHMYGDRVAIASGTVPRALGFDLYETNNLFPSGNSVMGLAVHPSAVAVAMRYLAPQPGNKYLDARPVTDPQTGMTIGLRDHYDENTGTRYVNLECVYGYSAGITSGACVIKRTD
jgi:hypothetical protein